MSCGITPRLAFALAGFARSCASEAPASVVDRDSQCERHTFAAKVCGKIGWRVESSLAVTTRNAHTQTSGVTACEFQTRMPSGDIVSRDTYACS
jgi:hypothetical protein